MKYFTFLLISIIASSCGAMMSKKLAADAPRSLEKVVEFPGKSSSELYVDLNTWMANYFNSAESVIDYSDKEAGKIVGKYVFDFSSGIYFYNGKSTMNIDIKDGRAKFLLTSPQTRATGDSLNGSSGYNVDYKPVNQVAFMEIFFEEWDQIIDDAVSYVKSNSDDW